MLTILKTHFIIESVNALTFKNYGESVMKVNIYDVAEKAGVSVVTVSRVLNNSPTVRKSSIKKVMDAVEALNYQPNAAARSLARGKTNVIGLILPNLSDSFLSEVVGHISRVLSSHQYALAISILDSEEATVEESKNLFFGQDRVDGMLVLTPLCEDAIIEVLESKKVPFVVMDNQKYPFKVPSVVMDNQNGGYLVGKHLIDMGHEKLGHIGGPIGFLSAEDRYIGFKKALEEVGIELNHVERGNFEIQTGFEVVMQWHENGEMPSAIFCADDNILFGALDALRTLKVSVPEEVSLVGYDDHPFCHQLHPNLTSVRQPAEQMAVEAVGLLMEMMSGDVKRNKVIKLEPEMIVRNSVKRT